MEAVAAVSSIIAIVEVSVNISVWCAQYVRDVAHAAEDIAMLSAEAGALASAAARLQPPAIFEQQRKELQPSLDLCLKDLLKLKEKLKPADSKINRLTWPFTKRNEVRDILASLHRHTANFSAVVIGDILISVEKLRLHLEQQDELQAQRHGEVIRYLKDEERANLAKWLTVVDTNANHNRNLAALQASSGQWFTKSQVFLDWLDVSSEGASDIWLCGQVGVGKSVLMSSIIEEVQSFTKAVPEQEPPNRPRIAIIYFYFDFREPLKQQSRSAWLTLIGQLANTDEMLLQVSETRRRFPIQSSIPSRDLAILFSCLTGSYDTVYIVLDALDECEDLLDFVQALKLAQDRCSQDCKLRILASSRFDVLVQGALARMDFERHDMELTAVQKDLMVYVWDQVFNDTSARFVDIDSKLKTDIVGTVWAQSHGMFQWAKCQLDELSRQNSPNDIRVALRNLPETLAETYGRILERIRKSDFKWARRLFIWLLGVGSPLRLGTIREAVCLDLDTLSVAEGDRLLRSDLILKICGSLVRCDDLYGTKVISLSHFSVQQYLENYAPARYRFNMPQVRRYLADACISFLMDEHPESLIKNAVAASDGPYPPESEDLLGLLAYCAAGLFDHMSSDGLEQDLLPKLIGRFCDPSARSNYEARIRAAQEYYRPPWARLPANPAFLVTHPSEEHRSYAEPEKVEAELDASPISRAAGFGLWDTVKSLINERVGLFTIDSHFWTPACFLAAWGSVEDLDLLLGQCQAPARINVKVDRGEETLLIATLGSALLTSIATDRQDVALHLLSRLKQVYTGPQNLDQAVGGLVVKLLQICACLACEHADTEVMEDLAQCISEYPFHSAISKKDITLHALAGWWSAGFTPEKPRPSMLESLDWDPDMSVPAWKLDRSRKPISTSFRATHASWQLHCHPELALEMYGDYNAPLGETEYQIRIPFKYSLTEKEVMMETKPDIICTIINLLDNDCKQTLSESSPAVDAEPIQTLKSIALGLRTSLATEIQQNDLDEALWYSIIHILPHRPDVTEILLLAGADPNRIGLRDSGSGGKTTLLSALSSTSEDVEKLEHTATILRGDQPRLWSPLMATCISLKGKHKYRMISLLLEHGANPNWVRPGRLESPGSSSSWDFREVGTPILALIRASISDGQTPECLAALAANNGLQTLNTYIPSDHWGTPLISAAAERDLDLVKLLLAEGAKADVPGHSHLRVNTPALVATHHGSAEVALLLLQHEAFTSVKERPQDWAEAFVHVCAQCSPEDDGDWDRLAQALVEHEVPVAASLDAEPGGDWEEMDDLALFGCAIIAACTSGSLPLVKKLLDRGASEYPKNTGIYGSCIIASCTSSNAELVKFWIDRGHDIRKCEPQVLFWCPLIAALSSSEWECQLPPLLEMGYDLNRIYPFRNEPVPFDAAFAQYTEGAESWHNLLWRRRVWNQTSSTGSSWKKPQPFDGSAVIAAVSSGYDPIEALTKMLEEGGNLHLTDATGTHSDVFAATIGVKRGRSIREWLTEHNVQIPTLDTRLNSPLAPCALDPSQYLGSECLVTENTFWGSALTVAVVHHTMLIPYLLSKGADPVTRVPGSFYGSALIAAAALLRGRALKTFIDAGASPNEVCEEGDFGTPLIAACAGPTKASYRDEDGEETVDVPREWEMVQVDMIEYLLESGADPNVGFRGVTPLWVMEHSPSERKDECINLLKDAGASTKSAQV